MKENKCIKYNTKITLETNTKCMIDVTQETKQFITFKINVTL